MKTRIEVTHKGITIRIRNDTTVVNGKEYTNYIIPESTSGKLVRHKRASLQEAKQKAKDICEAIAGNKKEVMSWDDIKFAEVRRALEILPRHCFRLDTAAQIVLDCLRYVDPDMIVEACRCFKNDHPSDFTPKSVKEAVAAFSTRQQKRGLSARRLRTEATYLNALKEAFAERACGSIQIKELSNMVDAKGWSNATRNDALNTFSQLYTFAIGEHWALTNPAKSDSIKRGRLGGSDIDFFTPGELRLIFTSIEDDLKPFMALWAFSGCRKEEASRVQWQQIDQGLKSGAILLRADQAKTGRKRSLPICDSLRAWLMKYRKPEGLVLPPAWQGDTEIQQIHQLDDMSNYIIRRTARLTNGPGLAWKTNGIRDAFALYHLKLHRDPRETVRMMGTSLRRLDENYLNITDSVALEDAQEWFAVTPERCEDNQPVTQAEQSSAA